MDIKNRTTHQIHHGFTIVELLIVIVVIGVLTTITIVAYNGVQDRARTVQAISGAEKYIQALGILALDTNSYPVPAVSGTIACFDGTQICNGGANQTYSTALYNAVKQHIPQLPLSFPYTTTLLTYASTADVGGGTYLGYYILFSIPVSQTCPQNVANARFLNTGVSGTVRSCRMALPTPN